MNINKRLAIQYARKLLPHFHLEEYKAFFYKLENSVYEYRLEMVHQSDLIKRNNENYQPLLFLFSDKESLYKQPNNGFELDITEDVNNYLRNIYRLDKEVEKHKLSL